MVKRTSGQELYSRNDKEKKQHKDKESRFWTQIEQIDRQKLKYEKMKAIDEKLAALSKLEFEVIDYKALLTRVPWQDWPIPDYSFLIEEARITTESKYFLPILIRGALLAVLGVIWLASSHIGLLWISGTVFIALGVSLFLKYNERSNQIIKAVCDAHLEVENKKNEEMRRLAEAKLLHEKAEDERIESIENLLKGEVDSVSGRLDEIFKEKALPFFINIDIDLYDNIPLIKVWLPDKTVIPIQEATLLSSGRINYRDKDIREINKQYIEVCAATIMQIISFIYMNVPSFDVGYAFGIIKGEAEDSCVLTINFDREKLKTACQASSGLSAVQILHAEFKSDNFLNFLPQQTRLPEEWKDVEPKQIRNLKFKVLHKN